MCRVLSGSPLMGCQDAGLLGRRGKHVSPSWLHTDLLLYQRNWTAADMGDNFLSGCAGMHCDLVPNTGLARRPVFITNCLLQSQRQRIFHVAAAPLDYYAHTQLPRIDISSGPSIRTTPVLVSMPAYHHHPLVNYQHATEGINRNGYDRVRWCKAPPLWTFTV